MLKEKFSNSDFCVGKTVKDLRKQKGIKQVVLANRCGITASYLSNIEAGKREPSYDLLLEFCKAFGVSLLHFVLYGHKGGISEDAIKLFNSKSREEGYES